MFVLSVCVFFAGFVLVFLYLLCDDDAFAMASAERANKALAEREESFDEMSLALQRMREALKRRSARVTEVEADLEVARAEIDAYENGTCERRTSSAPCASVDVRRVQCIAR